MLNFDNGDIIKIETLERFPGGSLIRDESGEVVSVSDGGRTLVVRFDDGDRAVLIQDVKEHLKPLR